MKDVGVVRKILGVEILMIKRKEFIFEANMTTLENWFKKVLLPQHFKLSSDQSPKLHNKKGDGVSVLFLSNGKYNVLYGLYWKNSWFPVQLCTEKNYVFLSNEELNKTVYSIALKGSFSSKQ